MRNTEDLNDKERLQERLEWEGYTETKVKSDGNCQFRALADQIYKSSNLHKQVRQEIVNQLKSHPKLYKGLVGKIDFSEYVKNMSNDSAWGDDITLKAAADVYGVKILIITSLKDVPSITVLPKSQKQQPDRVVCLSYLAGIHFNSIHLNEGSSSDTAAVSMGLQRKKKKKNQKQKKKHNVEQ